MTPENLLKPRYKVIADYPGSRYKIDRIISEREGLKDYDAPNDFDKYPAIFKLIEWWEERKEEDMPDYVKWNEVGYMGSKNQLAGLIEKVTEVQKYGPTWLFQVNSQINAIRAEYFLPATQTEYENQKTIKQI